MLPPTGTKVTLASLGSALCSSRDMSATVLRRSFAHYLGISNVLFMGSGRAALAVTLKVLAQHSSRDEVIIPAYTCFSVPSAIVRAGFKVRVCDISLDTLDFDLSALEKLINHRTLCIIPSHLFGLPNDVRKIHELAKKSGAFLVDDAAQALGASLHGRKVGTLGDVGIFSLGRGKNITTYHGGIIVTADEEITRQFRSHSLLDTDNMRRVPSPQAMLGLLCYAIFFPPYLYWLLDHCPFLQLGSSKFDPDFPMDGFSRFQCSLALAMLSQLDAINEQRRENALYLSQALRNHVKLHMPEPIKGSYPVYLRFPFTVLQPDLRERLYHQLRRAGFGVSTMYPTAIHRIPRLSPYLADAQPACPGADLLAASILTLPTHSGVTKQNLDGMLEVIDQCTRL